MKQEKMYLFSMKHQQIRDTQNKIWSLWPLICSLQTPENISSQSATSQGPASWKKARPEAGVVAENLIGLADLS